jgi:uncharacterized protein YdeI (YjbR/CyaY-like superfamily)
MIRAVAPCGRMPMPSAAEFPEFLATSRAAWRGWLEENHATAPGVWLVTYKKSSGKPHLPYGELVEEALCFGWIDSKGNKVDEERTKLLITPRKRGSGWSRVNKERIERLVANGLMTPAGLAKIEAAKADGSWTFLDGIEAMVVPDDLDAALRADAAALAGWERFAPSVKKPLLQWIASAKRPETRAKRVAETVAGAREGRNPIAYVPKEKR